MRSKALPSTLYLAAEAFLIESRQSQEGHHGEDTLAEESAGEDTFEGHCKKLQDKITGAETSSLRPKLLKAHLCTVVRIPSVGCAGRSLHPCKKRFRCGLGKLQNVKGE